MPKLVWLNGVVSPLESATVHVSDHAHLYGDGLFEGIRMYSKKVFKLDEHVARLFHGAKHMGFEQMPTEQFVKDVVVEMCAKSEFDDAYIRVNLTRGTGLGLDPKNIDRRPNLMVMINSLALYRPEDYEVGLNVVSTSYRVIPADALDPRIKCIGRYASNIMAKAEANSKGAGEGLMLNHQGHIAECTGDNIFLVKDGVIRTPHTSSGILCGITRNTVIEIARRAGYTVEETFLTIYDVHSCDEAFLTGTAAEVIAMVSLDDRPIGNGKPGKVTEQMTTLFREETKIGTPVPTVVNASA
ncbi:MAG: branched-chain-amino-acid transaminase [Chthonomonas sp.]|nr:branched-chain-amino-acid transaminase [Chthonomonas sp.]